MFISLFIILSTSISWSLFLYAKCWRKNSRCRWISINKWRSLVFFNVIFIHINRFFPIPVLSFRLFLSRSFLYFPNQKQIKFIFSTVNQWPLCIYDVYINKTRSRYVYRCLLKGRVIYLLDKIMEMAMEEEKKRFQLISCF